MTRRSPLRLIVVGVGALYLALLIGFTVGFAGHVPSAAWIGFAIVAVIVATLVTATIALFERSELGASANPAAPLPPLGDGRQRLLVVADAGCRGNDACARIVSRVDRDARPYVRVVAPTIASPLHHMTDDEGRERDGAGRRLDEVVSLLREEGIRARGLVGSDLPLEAIQDALAVFPADEIVVLAPPPHGSAWSERDLVERARAAFGRPVVDVEVARAA
jgi:hypothetical protein